VTPLASGNLHGSCNGKRLQSKGQYLNQNVKVAYTHDKEPLVTIDATMDSKVEDRMKNDII
jgi:hypothetical protein